MYNVQTFTELGAILEFSRPHELVIAAVETVFAERFVSTVMKVHQSLADQGVAEIQLDGQRLKDYLAIEVQDPTRETALRYIDYAANPNKKNSASIATIITPTLCGLRFKDSTCYMGSMVLAVEFNSQAGTFIPNEDPFLNIRKPSKLQKLAAMAAIAEGINRQAQAFQTSDQVKPPGRF